MKRVIVIIIAVVSSILMIASFSMIGCKADAAVTEEAAAGTEVEEESTEGTEVEETKVEETSALEVTPGTQINVFVDGGINSFPFEQVIDEIKN